MGYVVTIRPEAATRYAGQQVTVEAAAYRRDGDLLVFTVAHGGGHWEGSTAHSSVLVLPAEDVANVRECPLRLVQLDADAWGYVPC
jgi:hypothetical protein